MARAVVVVHLPHGNRPALFADEPRWGSAVEAASAGVGSHTKGDRRVTTLMGVVDQSTGSVVEVLHYNTTGWIKSIDGTGNPNEVPGQTGRNIAHSKYIPFGWTGMYHDRFTGLYHTHFREYDAGHSRWLSEDPAGYVDGLSLYAAYMGVDAADVLGLKAFNLWGNSYCWPWESGANWNPLKSVFAKGADQVTGKVLSKVVFVDVPISGASGRDMAGGFLSGAADGIVVEANALTFGLHDELAEGASILEHRAYVNHEALTQWGYGTGKGGAHGAQAALFVAGVGAIPGVAPALARISHHRRRGP